MHLRLVISQGGRRLKPIENGKIELTIEEKWNIVKRYYETTYKDPITKAYIKFNSRPNDVMINYLFVQMKKLVDCELEQKNKKK